MGEFRQNQEKALEFNEFSGALSSFDRNIIECDI